MLLLHDPVGQMQVPRTICYSMHCSHLCNIPVVPVSARFSTGTDQSEQITLDFSFREMMLYRMYCSHLEINHRCQWREIWSIATI